MRTQAESLSGLSLPPWTLTAAIVLAVVAGVGAWAVLRRPAVDTASLPHVSTQGEARSGRTSTTLPHGRSGSTPSTTTGSPVTSSAPSGALIVHVAGAVIRPGVVTLPSGSRAVDAVNAAGGLAPGAEPDRINLAAPLVDGERLAVPLVGQPPPQEVAPLLPGTGATGPAGAPGAGAARVDLNTATPEQLDTLPGVGPSTAAAIVAYRNEHGPFRSVDGLLEVRGIGETRLESLRDLVTVDAR